VIPEGFEPSTYCLEGSCSIQLSYGTIWFKKGDPKSPFVEVAGFEPTTSCSQSRRDTGLRYTSNGVQKYKFFRDEEFYIFTSTQIFFPELQT
jgi:hypothetical protein